MRKLLDTLMFVYFSLFAIAANGEKSQSIKFSDLATLVKEKNGYLKAEQSKISSKESRVGYLSRSFLPKVSSSLGSETFKTASKSSQSQEFWSVGTSVNLYNGGRDQLEENLRLKDLELSKGEYKVAYILQLREAQIAYWEIVSTLKLIELRREESKKNQELLSSAKRRLGAGLTTTADVLQFELHRSKLEQEIERLHLRLDEAKSRLGAILGISDSHGIELGDELPHTIVMDIESLQVSEQIELKQTARSQDIEAIKSQSEGRGWMPQLDLYASRGVPTLSDEESRAELKESESKAGVLLTFDLGKMWDSMAEKKALDFKGRALNQKKEQKSLELKLMDQELRHDFSVTSKILDESEKIIDKTSDFLKLTQAEYARGLRNGPDLLGALRQYHESLEASVNLKFSLLKTKAILTGVVSRDDLN